MLSALEQVLSLLETRTVSLCHRCEPGTQRAEVMAQNHPASKWQSQDAKRTSQVQRQWLEPLPGLRPCEVTRSLGCTISRSTHTQDPTSGTPLLARASLTLGALDALFTSPESHCPALLFNQGHQHA
jgi:hypothetical protein